MQAGVSACTDKEGRDYCIVVVKGTFAVNNDGKASLAEEQESLIYADVHYGDPGTTSIRYESDFAPVKPKADVLVNGYAYSPTGRPVTQMEVELSVGSVRKRVKVYGDRRWMKRLFWIRSSKPTPFVKMPLLYERSFGGTDHSHDKVKYHGTELRNPVGVGFRKNPEKKSVVGKLLPNLENPDCQIRKWSDNSMPAGFGTVGRGWRPRIQYGGTYAQQWLDNRFPFLPADFDEQYFQSAPTDQQFPHLSGGQVINCLNMTPGGKWSITIPQIDIPVVFKFRDREVKSHPNLDTVILEPDSERFMLVWRTRIQIRNFHAIDEVLVGRQPQPVEPIGYRGDKPRFKSISDLVVWKRQQGFLNEEEE